MSESILEEAQRLIHGDRNQNYGHPRDNFKNIAQLFSGYLDREVSEIDVANLMILVKVARVKGGPYHRDSFTDIAGYAGCVERIYEEESEGGQVETKANPKSWDKLEYVPEGVVVISKSDGGYFRFLNGKQQLFMGDGSGWQNGNHNLNDYAPFTEVPAPEPQPRVWGDVESIPSGVVFNMTGNDMKYRKFGSLIQVLYSTGSWNESAFNGDHAQDPISDNAPFTEVL